MHVHHAFQDVCTGYMYYDEFADSVVWSTGDVGYMLSDLAPGTYGFVVYENGQVVNQGSREVELVDWNFTSFNGDPYMIPGLVMFSGTLEVPHCVAQIFDGVCCMPDPAQTTLFVLQDGMPYPTTEVLWFDLNEAGECTGCTGLNCTYWVFQFLAPPGHVYTVGLNDPVCAGVVMSDTTIVAPSCANLELVMEVMDATNGQSDGSIVFVQAIPDPNEPYPIQAPVTGSALLYQMPDGELIGNFDNVASAVWDGLPSGEYVLTFMPDAQCQMHSITLLVGTGTTTAMDGVDEGRLRVFPAVADEVLYVISEHNGPIQIRILDLQGRVVANDRMFAGPYAVESLVPGPYLLIAEQDGTVIRTRFIKR